MKEIEFDEFFKDNFDTTGIEDNIYNQIAKDLARGIDIDLAKTPLVDILTGYTRYKIQELEIERLNNIINKAVKYIYKNSFDKEEFKCWFRVFNTDLHGYAQKLLDILKEKD